MPGASLDTTPYWMPDTTPAAFPPLTTDLTVDVIVVGGGITGVTAACTTICAWTRTPRTTT